MLTGTLVDGYEHTRVSAYFANMPASLPHVRDIAMAAWLKSDRRSEFRPSDTKIMQGPSEPCADFIGRFKDAIKKQVKGNKFKSNSSWFLIMPMKTAKG